MSNENDVRRYLSDLQATVHDAKIFGSQFHNLAVDAGWWHDLNTGEPLNRNKGELLCLIHSEISETMEAERKDLMDSHLVNRKAAEVELADAVIRIFDYAEAFGYDVVSAMVEKAEYNARRLDHKAENRKLEHGKKF